MNSFTEIVHIKSYRKGVIPIGIVLDTGKQTLKASWVLSDRPMLEKLIEIAIHMDTRFYDIRSCMDYQIIGRTTGDNIEDTTTKSYLRKMPPRGFSVEIGAIVKNFSIPLGWELIDGPFAIHSIVSYILEKFGKYFPIDFLVGKYQDGGEYQFGYEIRNAPTGSKIFTMVPYIHSRYTNEI